MTQVSHNAVPFESHIELMRLFLAQRLELVGRLQEALNARRRPTAWLQDRPFLAQLIQDCFFTLPAVSAEQAGLAGELEAARRASGFQPRQVPELFNDLFDPAEMMVRGFFCWQQTRWPGRNGRVRYAHTLFDLFVLRRLVLLSLRIWDGGADGASARLAEVQAVLDELWRGAPADQPVLVRDARWLIPLAQSPTTDELAAYFDVAAQVAESLAEADRLEIQKAHVRVLGGHLTSQIRHYCLKDGVTLNDKRIVLRTRRSNALDFALLVQALVPLLEAYARAIGAGDEQARFELAGAICQGISPDPELFLNQVDLLGAHSMIEHVFVAAHGDGTVDYSPMGQRHIRLFGEYAVLIARLSPSLSADHPRFRPMAGSYSPYGAIFGSPSNLIEDMALKTLQHDSGTPFSLEDVLAEGEAAKLAWVSGWRKLPHVPQEVQQFYEYPQQFAEDLFERIEQALKRSVADGAGASRRTGQFTLNPESDAPEIQPETYEQPKLLRDRQEGYFLVSYGTPDGWVALKKDLLTEVLAAGQDAKVVGLPPAAAATLRLMCPDLVRD